MRKTSTKMTSANEARWLVLAAWPPELAHLRASLPELPAHARRRVTLAAVGVGMVEAAIATAQLIAKHQPSVVLLVGTAGVYPGQATELGLDSTALVRRIRLLPQILPSKHAFLPAIVPDEARSSPTLVRTLRKATGLPYADVACPLGITATKQAAMAAGELSGCVLENLEAFAVARAAALAKIPFGAILGISNRVGPDGHREWERHAKDAAQSACQGVLDVLRMVFTTGAEIS